MNHYKIPLSSLEVTVDDILTEMGYESQQPDIEVVTQIENLLYQLNGVVTAECAFEVYDGIVFRHALLVNEYTLLEVGPVIAPLMKGANLFAVFAATAGMEFEGISKQIGKQGDILESFIVDIIGTCIVEKTGDYMEKCLESVIGNVRHTHRFSPGYCSWALAEQKKIFRLLNVNPCGIILSDLCLMNPIKSISGIVGIGENVTAKKYACNYCELETCYKRKLKKQHT